MGSHLTPPLRCPTRSALHRHHPYAPSHHSRTFFPLTVDTLSPRRLSDTPHWPPPHLTLHHTPRQPLFSIKHQVNLCAKENNIPPPRSTYRTLPLAHLSTGHSPPPSSAHPALPHPHARAPPPRNSNIHSPTPGSLSTDLCIAFRTLLVAYPPPTPTSRPPTHPNPLSRLSCTDEKATLLRRTLTVFPSSLLHADNHELLESHIPSRYG